MQICTGLNVRMIFRTDQKFVIYIKLMMIWPLLVLYLSGDICKLNVMSWLQKEESFFFVLKKIVDEVCLRIEILQINSKKRLNVS